MEKSGCNLTVFAVRLPRLGRNDMKKLALLNIIVALTILVPLAIYPALAAKKPKVEQRCPGQQYCYSNCRPLNPSLQQCEAYCKSTVSIELFAISDPRQINARHSTVNVDAFLQLPFSARTIANHDRAVSLPQRRQNGGM
jgi:hypothetical protein